MGLELNETFTTIGSEDIYTIDSYRLEDTQHIGARGYHNTLVSKDPVVRNFVMTPGEANHLIEDCSFIQSRLAAADCTLLVKNSSTSHSADGTKVGDGGVVSLRKSAVVFDIIP